MTELGRIVGLDVGEVRTGVAISDPLQIIASPHGTVSMASAQTALAELARIVREAEAVRVVVGVPLDRECRPGTQAEKVLAFVERVRGAVDIDIVTQDERYSSAAAERALIAADVRRKKRKQVVDKIAATHILQTYLDRLAAERKRQESAGSRKDE